jgi:hypothetical protein
MKIGHPLPPNQLIAHIENENAYFQRYPHQQRILRDIPCTHDTTILPHIVDTYQPLQENIPAENKHKLLLLLAFKATYHVNITPLTPDMVFLVIDTGASISITLFKKDFISPIKSTHKSK